MNTALLYNDPPVFAFGRTDDAYCLNQSVIGRRWQAMPLALVPYLRNMTAHPADSFGWLALGPDVQFVADFSDLTHFHLQPYMQNAVNAVGGIIALASLTFGEGYAYFVRGVGGGTTMFGLPDALERRIAERSRTRQTTEHVALGRGGLWVLIGKSANGALQEVEWSDGLNPRLVAVLREYMGRIRRVHLSVADADHFFVEIHNGAILCVSNVPAGWGFTALERNITEMAFISREQDRRMAMRVASIRV